MKRMMHTTARRPVALLLALLLLCTLALTGCEKEKPEDVVADMNALLESVKGGSTAEVAFLYGMTPDELAADSLYTIALGNITYVVGNVNIEDYKATATVAVQTVDMAQLLTRYTVEYLEATEDSELLGQNVFSSETWFRKTLEDTANLRFAQNAATVYLTKANGVWVLDRTADQYDFANALSGGMLLWGDSVGNVLGNESAGS
jgi:hypothetical protein